MECVGEGTGNTSGWFTKAALDGKASDAAKEKFLSVKNAVID